MWRVCFLVACVNIFSLSACLGMSGGKENRSENTLCSSKKRKSLCHDEEDKTSSQKQGCRHTRKPLASLQNSSLPLSNNLLSSPSKTSTSLSSGTLTETPERRFWKPFKKKFIESGLLSERGLTSPEVRKIYRETDTGDFFSSCIRFEGKTVFQADDLFDPSALALNIDGKWETNLERMKRGLSPIGHKGIFKEDTFKEDTFKEDTSAVLSKFQIQRIRRTQRKYRIELQHMTQKDTGLDDDSICEMTHDAHMGEDTRHIVRENSQTGEFEIVASSLKLAEALRYLELHPECFMVADVLHFRTGHSLIDREEFALWRIAYWKARAEDIKIGVGGSKPQVKRALFMDSGFSSSVDTSVF